MLNNVIMKITTTLSLEMVMSNMAPGIYEDKHNVFPLVDYCYFVIGLSKMKFNSVFQISCKVRNKWGTKRNYNWCFTFLVNQSLNTIIHLVPKQMYIIEFIYYSKQGRFCLVKHSVVCIHQKHTP